MRCVLIVHPDAARRREIRESLGDVEVLEAAGHADAVALLKARRPTVVVAHHQGFKRLMRDFERYVPDASRAALCPSGDAAARQELVDFAAHGYDFETLDESSPHEIRRLVAPPCFARRRPSAPLTARFLLEGHPFEGAVETIANDGLVFVVAPTAAAVRRLVPRALLEQAHVRDESSAVMVLEPRPWYVHSVFRGEGLRVCVGFQDHQGRRETTASIADEVRVRALLRRTAARGESFTLARSDGSARRRFPQGVVSHSGEHVFLRGATRADDLRAGTVVRLGFDLGGVGYDGLTTILQAGDEMTTVARPALLFRRHCRGSPRASAAKGLHAFIHLEGSLDGTVVSRRLLDLHPSGAAFAFDPEAELFPTGLVIPHVTIEVAGCRVRGSATVQDVSHGVPDDEGSHGRRWRCGLRLSGLSSADDHALREAVMSVLEPMLVNGGHVPFAAIWEMYSTEAPTWLDHPYGDLATRGRLTGLHRQLADGRSGLGRTFAFLGERDELLGHASGLRTHSRTWLSQHLLVRAGYHRAHHLSQRLVNATFDYGELLPDVEYITGLWRAKNRWAVRVFGGATSRVIRPGLGYVIGYTPMRRGLSTPLPPGRSTARRAEPDDLACLLAHLRQTEDPVRLAVEDLVEGELELETLGRRYAAVGLHRSRTFGVVDGGSGPRGFVMVQLMSPGLFWAEMYTSFRVSLLDPLADDADEVRTSLVAWACETLRTHGRSVAECHAQDADLPHLEGLGFTSLGRVMECGAHRTLVRDMTTQVLALFDRLAAFAPEPEEEIRCPT